MLISENTPMVKELEWLLKKWLGIYLWVVTFSQKYVQLASPTDVCIYNDAIKFHRIGFCQSINAELKIFTSSLTESLTVVSLGKW